MPGLCAADLLGFPGYDKKLRNRPQRHPARPEAVICGDGT